VDAKPFDATPHPSQNGLVVGRNQLMLNRSTTHSDIANLSSLILG